MRFLGDSGNSYIKPGEIGDLEVKEVGTDGIVITACFHPNGRGNGYGLVRFPRWEVPAWDEPTPGYRQAEDYRYTRADLEQAVREAYEDAARIVMEPRGDNWNASQSIVAERLVWRGTKPNTRLGDGALPSERLAAHARGLPVPSTLAEVLALGIHRGG